MKKMIIVLWVFLLGCSGAEQKGRTSETDLQEMPNVVIITWHDTGKWLRCCGNENVHTPNIDALAARGVLFTNYFSNSSVCSPSRSAMLTGRYPQINGCVGLAHGPYNYSINEEEEHLSEVLRDAGYDTRLFGWQHETTHDLVHQRLGFNELYLNDPLPPCNEVVDTFLYFVANRDPASGPFYAQIGFFETHRPFDFGGVSADSSRGIYIPPYLRNTPSARKEIALMQGSIKKADAQTGRILDALHGLFIGERWFVRTEKYKLIMNFAPESNYRELPVNMEKPSREGIYPWMRENWPLGELYDLEKDPREFENLYYKPEYREKVTELSLQLNRWMESIGDPILEGPMPDPWYNSAIRDRQSNLTNQAP